MNSNSLSNDKGPSLSGNDIDGSNYCRTDDIGCTDQEDKLTNAESINGGIGSTGSHSIRKSSSTRSKPSVFRAIRLFKRAKSTLKNSISVNTDLSGSNSQQDQELDESRPKRRRNSSFRLKLNRTDEDYPEQELTTTNENSTASSLISNQGELLREIIVHRYETGQYLIDNLRKAFEISNTKYFGLKIVPNSIQHNVSTQIAWVKLNKSVYKQILSQNKTTPSVKSLNNDALADSTSINERGNANSNFSSIQFSVDIHLHIRYYPSNTATLQDQFLKQYLWLQLKRDLRIGKLTSTFKNLSYLMACVIQHDYGDYKPDIIDQVKESHCKIVPHTENSALISSAIDVWREQLVGCKQHQTQMRFLRAAMVMETYGFDFHPVRDHQRRKPYLLGFNHTGLKTIRHGQVEHNFWWYNISKVSYERQMLILHIEHTNGRRKQILGFECLTNKDCRNLCSLLLDHKNFFTSESVQSHVTTRRPSQLFSCNEYSTVDLLNSDLMDGPVLNYEDYDEDDEEMSDEEIRRLLNTSSPQSGYGKVDLDEDNAGEHDNNNGNENEQLNRDSPDSLNSANSDNNEFTNLCNSHRKQQNTNLNHIGLADNDRFADEMGGLPGKTTTAISNRCDICKLTTSARHHNRYLITSTAASNAKSSSMAEMAEIGVVKPLAHKGPCTNQVPQERETRQVARKEFAESGATINSNRMTISEETAATADNNLLGKKMINLLERSLVQPIIECLACNNDNDSNDRGITPTHSRFPLTTSIIVLCMLILLTNMMLNIVNTVSGNLIELLSFGKQSELQEQQQMPL